MTKQQMIDQGYVPPTCTMPDPPAGILIYSQISEGKDPCDGCNLDRSVCKGREANPDNENTFFYVKPDVKAHLDQ